MAQVAAKNDTSILKIKTFLGLDESPDGDTTLKAGELSEMRNFRITQDGHLQIRPGSKTVVALGDQNGVVPTPTGDTALHGVWRGAVGGKDHTLIVWGGNIWDVEMAEDGGSFTGTARSLGTAAFSDGTFFGFGGKVYFLNGSVYQSWDGGAGTGFQDVTGYVPLVQTATTPAGAGTLLEPVNRMNGLRRVQFSPDGTATRFVLPENLLSAILTVTVNGTETTAFTEDLADGSITMTTAPAAGTNTVEITYRKGTGDGVVTGMKYAEFYNGSTDTRVFLYGDGTNRAIYSGILYETGEPSAEYFPDLYELRVGESNTPLTALVRHYSRLMAFKPSSAWVIQYGVLGLEDGSSTPAFTIQPVNRQFGNDAPGQVKLLENNPITLDVGSVYEWRSGGYSTYITANESNAKRISDRVKTSIAGMDMSRVRTFNLKYNHEFWIVDGDRALILNYANDAWYLYTGLEYSAVWEQENEVFGVGEDGDVVHISRGYRNDNGESIDAYAATGAMDFDKDWLLKYSPMIFVALQPESGARIYVTVETNRRSEYPEKLVSYGLATFLHADFNHFSFGTNRKPQVKRVKMKVKKATFYKLIFKSNSATATATVIGTDVKLRYAGFVK